MKEKGLTLIEVMITMAVVAIFLMGIMIGNAALQHAGEAAFERTRATQDAHRVIEMIRQSAKTVVTFPDDVVILYPDGQEVDGFDALSNEIVTVTYEDATTDPLDLTVNVAWLENGRRAVNFSMRAMVTQR